MLWVWMAGCFAIWLGAGYWFWKSLPRFRGWLSRAPRSVRSIGGVLALVGSAALLWLGLQWMAGAGQPETLSPFMWLAMLGLGLVFVLCQCAAAAAMLSLVEPDVTNRVGPPSINEGKDS